MAAPASDRPPVTVVLPFHGSRAEAEAAIAELGRLRRRPGDALVMVDNTEASVALGLAGHDGVTITTSPVKRSPYAARNFGAERAHTDWILFVDADCRLAPDLLDRYFDPPPPDGAGAVAGQVTGTPTQPGSIPAYVRSRRHLDQTVLQHHPYRPMAVTANLLVRREAWLQLGGFAESIRSGGDADFCWRLQDAGWTLEHRPDAAVTHDHRSTVGALVRQAARVGAGSVWLARRHAGYRGLMGPGDFARAAIGVVAWPLLGQPRRGLFKALDGVWGAALQIGALTSNAVGRPPEPQARVVVLVQEFPRSGDPLVGMLAAESSNGRPIRVEALRRPAQPGWREARAIPADYWEDDSPAARARSTVALLLRRRRGLPSEVGPPSRRLRRAAPGARLLVEPSLLETARELIRAGGRTDMSVAPIADRATALGPAARPDVGRKS